MATSRTQLGQAAIGVGVATIYTVPAGTKTTIVGIDVCNTVPIAALRMLRIFLVPNAGAPGTTNALFYDAPIPGRRTLHWHGVQILDTPGDTIQVQASAVGLTITVSGIEET